MQIEVVDLKKLLVAALDHIVSDLGVTSINLDGKENFYWQVAAAQMWDMATVHPNLDVGSLVDDCEFTLQLARALETDSVPPDPYSLIHVAPLLRYIAEHIDSVRP